MTGTPDLATLLARRIDAEGPMPLADYMALALGHPEFGYYATRDPLGAAGDFITAPEISQMFGELIGLWLADCWLRMGRPDPVLLVELGPGRGTLMADALRAMRTVPGLTAALRPHLVETSPTLRAAQATRLAGAGAAWHDRLPDVPAGPMLLVANEFFDALPIRQFQRVAEGWRERLVARNPSGDGFAFVLSTRPDPITTVIPTPLAAGAPVGSIVELCPAAWAIAGDIGRRLASDGGAALVVDYGHAHWAAGDTLQAVRRHRYADPLAAPGDADLTAHVNFAALADAVRTAGARATPVTTQGRLLTALGIRERAAALRRRADARQGAAIDAALERLITPAQMGDLFKAVAFHDTAPWTPTGFETP